MIKQNRFGIRNEQILLVCIWCRKSQTHFGFKIEQKTVAAQPS